MTDTATIQHTNNIERAQEMIQRRAKASTDVCLYYHYQTIKEELYLNYLREVRDGLDICNIQNT